MTVVYHKRYLDHLQDQGHPERPERLTALMGRLEEEGLDDRIVEPEPATPDDLMLVHTRGLLDHIRFFGEGHLDINTYCRPETYDIALLSAGGAIEAIRRGYSRKAPAFCFSRPPGHHAGGDFFGGFCYFNNMAVAIEKLKKERTDVEKVAIVDIDVHHGNGTSDVFYKRSDVLFISTHQWGIFPGTGHHSEVGEESGEGFNINITLPGGCGDSDYALAMERIALPMLREFEPDFLCIDMGGDAHFMDPLAGEELSSPGYVDIMGKLYEASAELCDGRCAVFLEGGYHLQAMAEIGAGAVARAYGTGIDMELVRPTVKAQLDLEPLTKTFGEYWDLG